MSTRDFRATQVRTHAIIGSGSSPQLLLYPSASATNQYGGVNLPGTGSDAWMFVSGAIGTTTGKVVFGGDLVISGSLRQGYNTVTSVQYTHAEGGGTTASATFAHAEGANTTASGNQSHAEGFATVASGAGAHAEGLGSLASGGYSHAEGSSTIASANHSHSEGISTVASGLYSHAEGQSTTASGDGSHAEGYSTRALTKYAHAEGSGSIAVGTGSHAGGIWTIASGSGQTVYGKYNLRNNSSSLFIIGNGTDDADANRSDVIRVETGGLQVTGTLSVTGNTTVEGNLTVNGTTTTVNTTNLNVKDSIILFGSGAVGTNRNGGIALASGSTETDKSLVFGRIANDTWGVGKLDVTNGTAASLASMDLVALRAGKVEIGGTTSFVSSSGASGDNLVLQGTAVHVTGAMKALNGFSGSHTQLQDGRSFLVAGTNVTITSASDGQITIASSAESYFSSTTAGSIFTTGSAAFRGGESGVDSPSDKGADVFFYVSGTIGGLASNSKKTVLGGDVVTSGTLRIDGAAGSGNSYLTGRNNLNVTFGTPGATSQLNVRHVSQGLFEPVAVFTGGTGSYAYSLELSGGLYVNSLGTDGAIFRVDDKDGGQMANFDSLNKRLFLSASQVTINQNSVHGGADVNFFVSGVVGSRGTGNRGTSVFSGDVVTSGSLVVRSGISGSHTKLVDGRSFLVAGTNVTITSASDGQITITSAGGSPGGSDRQIQFNNAGSFGGDAQLSYNSSTNLLMLTGSFAQGNAVIANGGFAHAQGAGTSATGVNSHAEGQSSAALGNASHVEGLNTTAFAAYSHAEGYATITNNEYSHAEGTSTETWGQGSHAEGYDTKAGDYYISVYGLAGLVYFDSGFGDISSVFTPGNALYITEDNDTAHAGTIVGSSFDGSTTYLTTSLDPTRALGATATLWCPTAGSFNAWGSLSYGSHAEGQTSLAAGSVSHAEGWYSKTFGPSSHAEGTGSIAVGSFSHVEGKLTTAVGYFSHAEGEGTVSIGSGSHAGGYYTIASGSHQAVIGKYNQRGNTSSLFVVGDGSGDSDGSRHDVFRVNSGSVDVTGSLWVSNGISGSHTSLTDGRSFLVAGTNVTIASASDGQITISSTGGGGGDSFFSSVTNGEIFTTGSIVTSGTFAIKDGAGLPRFRVSTTGNAWITGSLVLTGTLSIGTGTVASGRDSFAHGSGARALADFSHAQGLNSIAQGLFSHAEGLGSANATYSHAEGAGLATAIGSHAEGLFSTAAGNYSHAEGFYTRTTRDGSHSEGYLTTGSGVYSHAEGSGSIAFGSASHAGGIYTIASGSGQTAYGQYNLRGNTSSLFVIGNGTGDANANRSDVLRVESTGLQVTGSGWFSNGISGSHTSLTDGRSFLVAGTNVTIVSASDGQITISSTGGGGGGDSFFSSTTAGSIFTTGSAAFKGAEGIDSPADKGADVFFYVSGAIGSRGTSTVGTAVFGGDVVISGTLFGGSPLKVGTDLQVTGTLSLSSESRFTATAIQLSGSSGVTGSLVIQNDITSESQLVLSSSTGFSTLNQTSVGDLEVRNTKLGGNMTLGVKTSAGNAVNFMTVRPNGAAVSTLVSILPSIYAGPANPVNSTDTNFFVGGTVGSRGGANRGTAVFGGDLVISGTVYTPTGMSVTGSITIQGDILPDGDRVQNLGSPTKRWAHVYTGDLHLRNERGDYTLIEEEEFLSIRFNKTGKRYRFLLEPVPHLDEDPNNLS